LLRISQLDWPRILFRRTTAILLGIAAVFSVGAVALIHSNINPNAISPLQNALVGIWGAIGALGFLALLVCMGFFWLKCDDSSRLNRTIWFLILLLGFFYGTPVAYYAIVYLPQALKRNRDHATSNVVPDEATGDPRRFGPFRRSLLFIWTAPALAVFTVLILPKSVQVLTALVAIVFVICSAAVAIESIFHLVLSVYRSGIRRSDHTD
jgi:hypothetical protein